MPKKQVDFTIKNNGLSNYSVVVNENMTNPIYLNEGLNSISLETNVQHSLVWWLVGNEGTSLKISAKLDGKDILPPIESKIPRGESRNFGTVWFSIS